MLMVTASVPAVWSTKRPTVSPAATAKVFVVSAPFVPPALISTSIPVAAGVVTPGEALRTIRNRTVSPAARVDPEEIHTSP